MIKKVMEIQKAIGESLHVCIFVDTNVLLKIFNKEDGYERTAESLAKIRASGWKFKISCITSRFFGDLTCMGEKYNVLKVFGFEVIPRKMTLNWHLEFVELRGLSGLSLIHI